VFNHFKPNKINSYTKRQYTLIFLPLAKQQSHIPLKYVPKSSNSCMGMRQENYIYGNNLPMRQYDNESMC